MSDNSTPLSGGGQMQAASDRTSGSTASIARVLFANVSRELNEEVYRLIEYVGQLKEQRAGFRQDRTGDDARRRLQNPRLRTTYVNERITALRATSIELREKLVKQMQEAFKPALKLELAEAELAAALALRAELDAVDAAREATGLYPSVAVAADYLFEEYRITHWHWANAGPDRLQAIAEILLRQDSGRDA